MSEASDEQQTVAPVLEQLNPAELLKSEIDQVSHFYNILVDFFTNYSFQLIGAFIIFIIGYMFAGKVSHIVLRICERHKLDITLSRFLANTSKMVVVILIAVVALGKLGVSVTPFIAAIGAISLGAGLALQGLLANYAAGFNIIIIRPFVVGDTICVRGETGIVKEVLLAYTIIHNEDNVEITIPNKHIVGEILRNSKEDSLLELSVGIAYQHNPIEVVELLTETITKLNIVSKDRVPQVGIDAFGDSSINLAVRLWTPTANLYAAKYEAYKEIYLALEKAKIRIPFPQRDIHLIKEAD